MIVLGLKCYSHATGAAILSDHEGSLKVVAIAEARLNRRKHSFSYPLMSIAYCLAGLGLNTLDEVDLICIDRHMEEWPDKDSQFGYNKALKRYHPRYDDNHRWNYLIEQSIKLDQSKCHLINHIDAHAASAYYASPFEEAAVLIAEGGTGIYYGRNKNLKIINYPISISQLKNKFFSIDEKTYAYKNLLLKENGLLLNKEINQQIYLTETELNIMKILIDNTVVKRETIRNKILNLNKDIDTKSLDSHLSRIRKKIKDVGLSIEILSINSSEIRII